MSKINKKSERIKRGKEVNIRQIRDKIVEMPT